MFSVFRIEAQAPRPGAAGGAGGAGVEARAGLQYIVDQKPNMGPYLCPQKWNWILNSIAGGG